VQLCLLRGSARAQQLPRCIHVMRAECRFLCLTCSPGAGKRGCMPCNGTCLTVLVLAWKEDVECHCCVINARYGRLGEYSTCMWSAQGRVSKPVEVVMLPDGAAMLLLCCSLHGSAPSRGCSVDACVVQECCQCRVSPCVCSSYIHLCMLLTLWISEEAVGAIWPVLLNGLPLPKASISRESSGWAGQRVRGLLICAAGCLFIMRRRCGASSEDARGGSGSKWHSCIAQSAPMINMTSLVSLAKLACLCTPASFLRAVEQACCLKADHKTEQGHLVHEASSVRGPSCILARTLRGLAGHPELWATMSVPAATLNKAALHNASPLLTWPFFSGPSHELLSGRTSAGPWHDP